MHLYIRLTRTVHRFQHVVREGMTKESKSILECKVSLCSQWKTPPQPQCYQDRMEERLLTALTLLDEIQISSWRIKVRVQRLTRMLSRCRYSKSVKKHLKGHWRCQVLAWRGICTKGVEDYSCVCVYEQQVRCQASRTEGFSAGRPQVLEVVWVRAALSSPPSPDCCRSIIHTVSSPPSPITTHINTPVQQQDQAFRHNNTNINKHRYNESHACKKRY